MSEPETLCQFYEICMRLQKFPTQNPLKTLQEIEKRFERLSPHAVKKAHVALIGALYVFVIPQKSGRVPEDVRGVVVRLLYKFFQDTKIEKQGFYQNILSFLRSEICDQSKDTLIRDNSEEYKLVLVKCIKALHSSLSFQLCVSVFDDRYVGRISAIVSICLKLAKHEKLRSLRIAAIECILSFARVYRNEDLNDVEVLSKSANKIMFFLPAISRTFTEIALEDVKTGNLVLRCAIKSLGRIIVLLMRDYDNPEQTFNLDWDHVLKEIRKPAAAEGPSKKWKNVEEVENYIATAKRDRDWFKKADRHLTTYFKSLMKLCHHTHDAVRLEFVTMCSYVLENCYSTIPSSLGHVVIALITLSEDLDKNISEMSRSALKKLSELECNSAIYYKYLFDNLEEHFEEMLSQVPNTFNGIDDDEKLATINLLCGYLQIFKKNQLEIICITRCCNLINALLCICELEKLDVRCFEGNTTQGFDEHDPRTPWKQFKHFRDSRINEKLKKAFKILAQKEILNIVYDYLFETFNNDPEHKKAATLLLNEIISESEDFDTKKLLVDYLISAYLGPENFSLPITPNAKVKIGEAYDNVIQVSLLLEGIGKLSLAIGENSKEYLLKLLFPMIEKAGSSNSVVRLAGTSSLANIAKACKYESVTDLINKNTDYFSFHMARKFKNFDKNPETLDIFGVVMSNSSRDMLPFISNSIEDVVSSSNDNFQKACVSFLRVFLIYIKCVMRWMDIEAKIDPIISKKQKLDDIQKEVDDNKREDTDFSDDIMGKTAEEMYHEDMLRKEGKDDDDPSDDWQNNIVNEEKPEIPSYVRLTADILKKSLNFLPAKDDDCKILVLDILKNGVEILRDFEDELLPIVHLIWSPLSIRFKDSKNFLIFNLSYQLLVTLGRLSKDFIRNRTVKDALPAILETLSSLSSKSYLKDAGSSYRHTQAFKLQLVLIEHLARLILDVEMPLEEVKEILKCMRVYLSSKQPRPLQMLCVDFYGAMLFYDPEPVEEVLKMHWSDECGNNIVKILDK